jgi:hypothetical protein
LNLDALEFQQIAFPSYYDLGGWLYGKPGTGQSKAGG